MGDASENGFGAVLYINRVTLFKYSQCTSFISKVYSKGRKRSIKKRRHYLILKSFFSLKILLLRKISTKEHQQVTRC